MENKANINIEDKYGTTPLFIAYWSGNYAIIKYLVEHEADVNKPSGYRRSLLNGASFNG